MTENEICNMKQKPICDIILYNLLVCAPTFSGLSLRPGPTSDIVLCSCVRHLTLTVSLSTQGCK